MHQTQLKILDSLRQTTGVKKFSDLMLDVAETSDNVTYHVKQLQRAGYVDAVSKGRYKLTERGTVYLNNNLELSEELFPTVSCLLELHNSSGNVLVMKKLKQPFFGQLQLVTFGIASSKSLREQINEFLARYKITTRNIQFKCVYRKRVQSREDAFVFDKFFLVFTGTFTTYRRNIDDREFSDEPPEVLRDSAQAIISLDDAVLSVLPNGRFAEGIFEQ